MASPGRRPTPTRLKIIKGTDQPCRIRKDEPKSKNDNIKMPVGMSPEAKKQWKKVVKELSNSKIITNLDVHALQMYCEAYSTWYTANQAIQKHGAVMMSKGGYPSQSPFLHVANKAFDQMKAMLIEFGMTPSARTRVSATDTKKTSVYDD